MKITLNMSFKDMIKKYILDKHLYKQSTNTIYTLDQILDVIEYILITGSSWRSLNLPVFNSTGYKWQSFYYHFIKFSKAGIFKTIYRDLLDKYFKKNKSGKLKYLSIDSSFIKNQYASNVSFNGFCKKKRFSKLSLIVDSNGVPISAILDTGNRHDLKIADKNLSNLLVKISNKNSKNNKHKRYFLADKAYNSKQFRSTIYSQNITPVIPQKRNSKNVHQETFFIQKEWLLKIVFLGYLKIDDYLVGMTKKLLITNRSYLSH